MKRWRRLMGMKQILVMMAVVMLVGCGKKVDATEQFELGMMYYKGGLVSRDTKKAVEFFQLAADQNHAMAQNMLGYMYINGEGVNKDSKKAVEFFRLAASQGLADAQTSLGFYYASGEKGEKDFKEAMGWFQKAANQGDAVAQESLSRLLVEHPELANPNPPRKTP